MTLYRDPRLSDREWVEHLKESVERGTPSGESLFELAEYLLEGKGVDKDTALAEKYMRLAAEGGFYKAIDRLGLWYRDGEVGSEPNPKEAVEWFTKGAEKLGLSQYHLGLCYQKNFGVPRNDTEAAKWFARAAENGLGLAQLELGFCHMNGRGVLRDVDIAIHWFNKAADNGMGKAKAMLKNIRKMSEKKAGP